MSASQLADCSTQPDDDDDDVDDTVSGVAQCLERQSLTGELSLICG